MGLGLVETPHRFFDLAHHEARLVDEDRRLLARQSAERVLAAQASFLDLSCRQGDSREEQIAEDRAGR